MLALFYNGIVEGFIKPSARQIVVLVLTAKELMECTPSHEQIGRSKIWEIAQLGYSTQLDAS
ncbi:cytokinin riboside 5'-monophosphate phosphoribohydrolase LOG8-like protein [Cinnamomum micranthum f. kanehirae]|uniref:Cytokinin riboside 5'-monophosphate phosphoribohydrolase LOG8-like protein n=1 Tax=Cinnamomum micranthum f. kanehirae TaxID=337451 RepID=A0A3S3Q2H5_9MAGN|nr:cytokinin riboside 5'-monophosphate phosphoribohydrolase LOG8-like protein [Cinnamomum micranthum f. kanehirae]